MKLRMRRAWGISFTTSLTNRRAVKHQHDCQRQRHCSSACVVLHFAVMVCGLQMGSTARQLELQDEDKAAVFQGGNYVDLHQMMGVKAGTEVLYVGDHIYGDILRSKKVSCYLLLCPLAVPGSGSCGAEQPWTACCVAW